MTASRLLTCGLALFGCVSAGCVSPADHFYTLNTTLNTTSPARSAPAPAIQVRLQVTIPSMVDRNEMVLENGENGILILDHERWAAPLSDQVSQTLARDMEKTRSDILVGDRGFDRTAAPPVTVKVDIVRMSARRGGRANIEAHWRIVDPTAGVDELGSGSFETAISGDDYAAIARAYSGTLGDLAMRLAQELRRP